MSDALYRVWDPASGDEAGAEEIRSRFGAEWVARLYAEGDTDTLAEGGYGEPGREIHVRAPGDRLFRFAVIADFTPEFTARLIHEADPRTRASEGSDE